MSSLIVCAKTHVHVGQWLEGVTLHCIAWIVM